ncbi:hypothetical protein [Parvibaculum sp.]|uniref:hypothetical protein n=1 Tax=Parvibaculum sp. TaxID=2024848 RepID=UPI0034A03AC4
MKLLYFIGDDFICEIDFVPAIVMNIRDFVHPGLPETPCSAAIMLLCLEVFDQISRLGGLPEDLR